MTRAFALTLLLLPAAAAAQSCRVDVVPLAFGVYDPAAAQANVARGDVTLVCGGEAGRRSDGGSAAVRLGGEAARALGGNGHSLRYAIFQDAALSRPWWSGASFVVALPESTRNGAVELHVPLYGRIAPGQWIAPGAYQDTIEVTVEF